MMSATDIALMALGQAEMFCVMHGITILTHNWRQPEKTLAGTKVILYRLVDGEPRELMTRNPAPIGERPTTAQALEAAFVDATMGEKSFAEFADLYCAGDRGMTRSQARHQHRQLGEHAAELRRFFSDIDVSGATRQLRTPRVSQQTTQSAQFEPSGLDELPTVAELRAMQNSMLREEDVFTAPRAKETYDNILRGALRQAKLPVHVIQFESGTSGLARSVGAFELVVYEIETLSTPSQGYARPLHTETLLVVEYNGGLWGLRQEGQKLMLDLPSDSNLIEDREDRYNHRAG